MNEDLDNPLSPEDEISPLHRKLVRALVTEDWSDTELKKALDVLRRLSRRRRSGPSGTGEHLTTRNRKDGKTKIVIEDGRRVISTGEDAVEGRSAEDNPIALIELAAHRRDVLEVERARHDPLSFEINYVLRRYIEAHKPGPKVPNRKKKMKKWRGYKNCAAHLMDSLEGWRLSDIDVDTGRWYYKDRLARPLYKGSRKDPENPKDSPAKAELYLLRRAIKWFVGKRKLRRTPSDFEMPAFTRVERDFFVYAEVLLILWACFGYSAKDGWKRTVKIPPATTAWLIRFFILYLLTGTRYDNNGQLFWGFNDDVGCIDAENGVIWRYGRLEIVSKTKPKRRSDLLPYMHRVVRRWCAKDLRQSRAKNIPFGLVIHDEHGDPPRNFVKTVNAVLDRAGVERSAHLEKHAGVTLLALMGYALFEIADAFGNDERSIVKYYRHIKWDRLQQRPKDYIELKKFQHLGLRSPPLLPRADAKKLTAKLRARGRLKS